VPALVGRWSLADIREARAALAGIALHTPLVAAPGLAARVGVPVHLKCEHLQPTGAFKIRGAWTALSRLSESDRRAGVVTHSSGNHGQAVACAARRAGVRAVVVMPASAPAVKVEGVRRHGGEVVFVERPATERATRTAELVASEGLTFIPPYEHLDVILGQATVGLEILEDAPDTHTIVAPIGGGGLLAGIAMAAVAVGTGTTVVGAEPAGAASFTAALAAGHPVTLDTTASLADGLLARATGTIPFAALDGVVQEAVMVEEDDIVAAMRWLAHTMGLRIEPSGVVGVAAVLSGRWVPRGPLVLVLSGGNVDPDLFHQVVSA